jgi:hypothetical protein
MIVSGQEFSLMEHILRNCTKRSFKSTLKDFENKYTFCVQQKRVIEQIKRERNIETTN